jgi:hypothetical protein
MRRARGVISESSSTHFSTSSGPVVLAIPVMLPPGRAKLLAKPEPTGSPVTETIGIVRVSFATVPVTPVPSV